MRSKQLAIKNTCAGGVLLAALLLGACTKNFEKYNTDPNKVTEDQLKGDGQDVGSFFPDMQISIIRTVDWEYQLQQNLNADVYCGYMMSGDPFVGGKNNTNYAMIPDWNTYPFDLAYSHVMSNWLVIKQRAQATKPDYYAVANIIKVLALHRVTDVYGPLPYTKYGQGGFTAAYDDQATIYKTFFQELDSSVLVLSAYVADHPDAKPFANFDLVYGGDYTKWIKLANSLRLRLAMRIVYADPVMAKQEAEAAVKNSYGTLTTNDDIAKVNMVNGTTYINPLADISHDWSDISMNAQMESFMVGYTDPRISKYFMPSSEGSSGFKGIRSGIDIINGSDYTDFSQLKFTYTDLIKLMVPAETYFLKAEGTLRGWDMGGASVQSLYEKGIATSFDQYAAGAADTYVADNVSKPLPYTDPKNANNNIPAGSPYLSTITIKWEESASFEQKLERIITQKWLALYPDGEEAWAEYRRTGYPKLFPVVVNYSGGTISTTDHIRRLPFPSSEVTNNATAVQQATANLLGGPDNGSTKLWWDKKS